MKYTKPLSTIVNPDNYSRNFGEAWLKVTKLSKVPGPSRNSKELYFLKVETTR